MIRFGRIRCYEERWWLQWSLIEVVEQNKHRSITRTIWSNSSFFLSKKMKFFRYFLMLSIVVFAKRDRSWYSFHTGFLLPGLFSLIATKSYDILNSWIFQIDLFTANHLTFNETWSTIKDKLQYFKKSLLPYVDNNW